MNSTVIWTSHFIFSCFSCISLTQGQQQFLSPWCSFLSFVPQSSLPFAVVNKDDIWNPVWLHLYEARRIVKFLESESTLVDAQGRGWGWEEDRELVSNGDRVLVYEGGKVGRWMTLRLHRSVNRLSAAELCSWKKVKVAELCPTLCDAMDYTVHGILQARTLEWVASPFSRGSSQCRNRTQVSCIAGIFFTSWTTREAQEYWSG